MVLLHGMTSRVALVMAPLLPRIRTGTGNMGLENGGGFKVDKGIHILTHSLWTLTYICLRQTVNLY